MAQLLRVDGRKNTVKPEGPRKFLSLEQIRAILCVAARDAKGNVVADDYCTYSIDSKRKLLGSATLHQLKTDPNPQATAIYQEAKRLEYQSWYASQDFVPEQHIVYGDVLLVNTEEDGWY